MTIDDYHKRLNELSDNKFKKFNEDFGGGQKTRDQRVREFVNHPEHERLICQLLGMKTEAEKLTEAALKSADAAVKSASSARLSMIWSGVACLAALAAAVAAIIKIF